MRICLKPFAFKFPSGTNHKYLFLCQKFLWWTVSSRSVCLSRKIPCVSSADLSVCLWFVVTIADLSIRRRTVQVAGIHAGSQSAGRSTIAEICLPPDTPKSKTFSAAPAMSGLRAEQKDISSVGKTGDIWVKVDLVIPASQTSAQRRHPLSLPAGRRSIHCRRHTVLPQTGPRRRPP